MDAAAFEELQQTLKSAGPTQAIDQLCSRLRQDKEYAGLFYALLMKKRFELGVSPLPSAPASELPPHTHQPYEDAIRDAATLVGKLFLDDGKVLQAFNYYRLLGQVEPVAQALEKYQLDDSEESGQVIQLAFHQGVHPKKGFAWVLERFGICSAITMLSGQLNNPEFTQAPGIKEHCIQQLVLALYNQLVERLQNDIERHDGTRPQATSVPELIAGRDWLFEQDNYHVDISHLGSAIQMSTQFSAVPPGEKGLGEGVGEALELARHMCQYGAKLTPHLQQTGDPPFQDFYKDYEIYLGMLAGEDVEKGIAHFRAKADSHDADYPINAEAETLVNLLLKLNRPAEGLEVARKYLNDVADNEITCPSIPELCRRVQDYQGLAEVARQRGDVVHFMAGLIAANHTPARSG